MNECACVIRYAHTHAHVELAMISGSLWFWGAIQVLAMPSYVDINAEDQHFGNRSAWEKTRDRRWQSQIDSQGWDLHFTDIPRPGSGKPRDTLDPNTAPVKLDLHLHPVGIRQGSKNFLKVCQTQVVGSQFTRFC